MTGLGCRQKLCARVRARVFYQIALAIRRAVARLCVLILEQDLYGKNL